MKNLIEPSEKYIQYIENSWHYLNCPKHMLNHNLDSLYRQGIVIDRQTTIDLITHYLIKYDIKKPLNTAINFVNWRTSISINEFKKININSYVDNTPKHIEAKHRLICEWTEKNTKYSNGIVIYVPSYF
jgi:hypothetical protein